MSSYFQAWGSVLTTCPDPATYTPVPPPVVGRLASAKPVAQGYEQGDLTWNALTVAEYADLWGRWNTNKDTSSTFQIPNRAGSGPTSFRSVVAYAEEPRGTWGQTLRMGVSMHIVIVG